MKVDRYSQRVTFHGEDSEELEVHYDNRGEPYRQGISLDLTTDGRWRASVFLENREAVELRDLLNRLYPPKPTARPA